jgi:hypothetical protein
MLLSGPLGVNRMTKGSPNQSNANCTSSDMNGRNLRRSVSIASCIECSLTTLLGGCDHAGRHRQKPYANRVCQGPVLRPFSRDAPAWPKTIGSGQHGETYQKAAPIQYFKNSLLSRVFGQGENEAPAVRASPSTLAFPVMISKRSRFRSRAWDPDSPWRRVECGPGAADAAGLASFVAVVDLVDTFILPGGLGRHDFADEIYRQGFAVVELSITDTIFTISPAAGIG